jgi:aryl-alcohol dehydrogenase-like predicted oxidoreductase
MSTDVPRIRLRGDYEISRVIKGGWQLAGDHGPVDPSRAPDEMADFARGGITTFDCADIYTGVEEMIGQFRARYPDLARQVRVHTKFVPDLTALGHVDAAYVTRMIDRSLQRLRMERLDVVQFHWWDFATPGYVETALELERLRQQGKIANVSVTNFDVAHLAEIVAAGVPVFSHQVQYSVLDTRPERGMVEFCQKNDIALFCYGTVAGGFLSDRWLGAAEPQALVNRSLIKYKLIIEDFGGWSLFQKLLRVLRSIADRHGCDIATVASAVILRKPQVAAVVVGATNRAHLGANQRIGSIELESADVAAIEAVHQESTGPLGDVYILERDIQGRHGRIMKYELNQ